MGNDPFSGARHLTLVDRRYLHELSKVERGMVHHYASELSLANEFDPGPPPDEGYPEDKKDLYEQLHQQWTTVREWLYTNMEMLVSVGARGRDDLVSVFTASQEESSHPDEGQLPPSASRMRSPAAMAKKASKEARGMGPLGLK